MTHEQAIEICDMIAATSISLRKACKEKGVSKRSFYEWIETAKANENHYTHARELQADVLADEIIEIADDGTKDTKQIRSKSGDLIEVEDTEWTNRSKLRVDARKFIAAKLKPTKYGDRVNHDVTVRQEQPLFPDVPADDGDK